MGVIHPRLEHDGKTEAMMTDGTENRIRHWIRGWSNRQGTTFASQVSFMESRTWGRR